jgi:drug/metabolite transporter (DMT)-like permease
MTLPNLLLILGSACIHVVAHVGLKRSPNRAAFVWWVLLWGSVMFAPLVFSAWPALPWPVVLLMLLSAGCEALYYSSIAQAYQTGDLSIVYPLARGTAPVLLLVWSVLFVHERPTLAGVAGIALIAAGLYVINLPRLGAWVAPLRALGQPGPRWALTAGLCTSLYTVIDRQALRSLGPTAVTWPLLYTYLTTVLTLVLLTPWTVRAVGASALRHEWRVSRWSTLISGFTNLAAYAVVLTAIRAGTPASYAGAVREISVVLGAIVGVLVLKEAGTRLRVVGSVCVAGGVAVIALFG